MKDRISKLGQGMTFCTRKLMLELASVIYDSSGIEFREGNLWEENEYIERMLSIVVEGKTVATGKTQETLWEGLKDGLLQKIKVLKNHKNHKK